jgi:hypothetical protein
MAPPDAERPPAWDRRPLKDSSHGSDKQSVAPVVESATTCSTQSRICPIACTGRTGCPLCLPGSAVTL